MTKKSGFTLAEVLITLGIIGVVAAMTIPTLMNNTGQREFIVGAKKALSVLNQAVTLNVALSSNSFADVTAGANTADTTQLMGMLMSRISVVSTENTNGTISKNMGTPFSGGTNYILFTNDGMAIGFPTAANQCTAMSTNCRFVVDVNGAKGPNKLSEATSTATTGRIYDQFVFDFFNQQVLPHGPATKYIMYQ